GNLSGVHTSIRQKLSPSKKKNLQIAYHLQILFVFVTKQKGKGRGETGETTYWEVEIFSELNKQSKNISCLTTVLWTNKKIYIHQILFFLLLFCGRINVEQ